MAIINPYTKKNKIKPYNWIQDDKTSTSIDDKVIQSYVQNHLYAPWDDQTKASLENDLTSIVQSTYLDVKADNKITWDINYTFDNTNTSGLYVTLPQYDETITATGSANILITYDGVASASTCASNIYIEPKPLTKEERIRQQLRQKLAPQILTRRFGVGRTSKDSEKKAREALRAIIGDQRFQRYLKHGFITVKGQSGLIYQVFPGHNMTRVWKNGKPVEKLCVVFCDSSVPPTDSVIMRLMMILDSEEEFRQRSNVMGFSEHEARQPLPCRIAA